LDNREDILRELLTQKMEQAELPVSDGLWTALEAQLPAAMPAAAGGGAAAKWVIAKWVGGLAVAAGLTYSISQLAVSTPEVVTPERTKTEFSTSPDSPKQETQEIPQALDAAQQKIGSPADLSSESPQKETTISQLTESVQSAEQVAPENLKESAPQINSSFINESSTSSQSQVATQSEREPSTASFTPLTALFSHKVVDENQLRWLFIPQEDNASDYLWEFGDGSVSASMAGAHTYSEEGEYTVRLTVTGKTGEQETQEIQIEVVRPASFYAANVFTPNGDSRNDVFDPLINSINIERLSRWIIFDESGKTVFESTSQFTWDGQNMNGDASPAGNYRYVIQAVDRRNNPVENSGTLRLLRK